MSTTTAARRALGGLGYRLLEFGSGEHVHHAGDADHADVVDTTFLQRAAASRYAGIGTAGNRAGYPCSPPKSVRPIGDSTASLPGSAGIAGSWSQVAHSMTATGFDPHTLLAESRLGVLATIKSDGRPQLSPVTPFYDRDADVIYVSMTEGRAKTANLRRDPRAALEVTSSDGWAWATAEGAVTLTGPGPTRTVPRSTRSWTTTAAPPGSIRTGTSTGR